nr:immunoglobulin heavy chain junction region [Mus musculus]
CARGYDNYVMDFW